MATFAIYTYQFERIVRSAHRQLEIESIPSPGCVHKVSDPL